MTEINPAYLQHQYLYIPWTSGVDTMALGKALGLHVSHGHNARLTVVTALKSNATNHDEFAKLPVVTERSGGVVDGGVVLAWCPTRKVMQKVRRLDKSVVILAEWPTENYEAWARLVGAYNVITGEVMDSGLTDAGMKALEGVVWEGYNGWHDDIAETMTGARLDDLRSSDGYDRALVLAYVEMHRGLSGIERLEKLLNRYEGSRSIAA